MSRWLLRPAGAASLRPLRRRLLLAFAVVALIGALGLRATGALSGLERSSLDARFALRGSLGPSRAVVVVGVDETTFNDLPNLRWPYPRHLDARILTRLRAAGAGVIAFDVQFTEQTAPAEDDALIQAAARTPRLVLATTETAPGGRSRVFGGTAVQRETGVHVASSVLPNDPGAVLRRLPAEALQLPTLAVTAAALDGVHVPTRLLGGSGALIDYRGPPGTISELPYSRVLEGRFDPTTVRGRVVVVGATAPTLGDVHPTSTSAREQMSGPEIQANAIATLLAGVPLRRSPTPVNIALIIVLALLVPLIALRARAVVSLASGVLLAGVYLLVAQLAFDGGRVLDLAPPLLALALATAGVLGAELLLAAVQEVRTRDVFSRFVPEAVVGEVLAAAGPDLRLGAVTREGTVLFADLRGFTAFAEQLEPGVVLEALNHYLTMMSDTILDTGGTLVSYMGDGIMAVFGAPLPQRDHADRALTAAVAMLERLGSFNSWLADRGHATAFRMGVGVASGPVMSGQVGSSRRVEYTALGATTNLASRLEAMTKELGVQVLVAEATSACLVARSPVLREIGVHQVRGHSRPLRLWTLAAAANSSLGALSDEDEASAAPWATGHATGQVPLARPDGDCPVAGAVMDGDHAAQHDGEGAGA